MSAGGELHQGQAARSCVHAVAASSSLLPISPYLPAAVQKWQQHGHRFQLPSPAAEPHQWEADPMPQLRSRGLGEVVAAVWQQFPAAWSWLRCKESLLSLLDCRSCLPCFWLTPCCSGPHLEKVAGCCFRAVVLKLLALPARWMAQGWAVSWIGPHVPGLGPMLPLPGPVWPQLAPECWDWIPCYLCQACMPGSAQYHPCWAPWAGIKPCSTLYTQCRAMLSSPWASPQVWKCGSTAPLLSNFWTCEEPCGLGDMVPGSGSDPWAQNWASLPWTAARLYQMGIWPNGTTHPADIGFISSSLAYKTNI